MPTHGSFLVWKYLFQNGIGEGKRCLDIGCGTGLLAIELARNGAEHVHAIDIDRRAVANTLSNAFRNGVADRITGEAIDLYPWVPKDRYDVVVASLYQMPVDPYEQPNSHRPLDFWGRNLLDHLFTLLPKLLAEDGVAYVMQLSILGQERTAELLAEGGFHVARRRLRVLRLPRAVRAAQGPDRPRRGALRRLPPALPRRGRHGRLPAGGHRRMTKSDRVPVHLRVGHRGPPGQGRRPDLRRRPRRRVMAEDPAGRVACETLVNTGLVVVSGEISTTTYVDIQDVARETIRKIGYVDADLGFSADSCAVINAIDKQSPDIAQGVDSASDAAGDAGAGDQGMMFGYASRRDARADAAADRAGPQAGPAPGGGAQGGHARLPAPRRQDAGHRALRRRPPGGDRAHPHLQPAPRGLGGRHPRRPLGARRRPRPAAPTSTTPTRCADSLLVNPTGRFVIGGPVGDAGLTGRKIIVDTYGGMARHGGGAFSGKDPSKVDRSAAYAARHVAKNVVAAGLAERCELQVAYAIGVAQPGVGHGRDLRHREDRARHDPRAHRRALRPAPRRVPRGT